MVTKNYFQRKIIFNKHNQRKTDDQNRGENKLNIQASLTKHLLDLLSNANEMTGPTNAIKFAYEMSGHMKAIKFAYSDMHGNLEFILNNPLTLFHLKQIKIYRK